MKKIVIIIALVILLIYVLKGKDEPYVDVDMRLFNEVEIPSDADIQKDPYYQFIKNINFPCMCRQGTEKNSRGECVDICPPGQTRFTDDKCYPPCPAGQTRHTNTVCYPPCPAGEFRHSLGMCMCEQKQPPTYDVSINSDVPGNDIKIIRNPSAPWPAWADGCRLECNNNPNCRAYNIIHGGGAWGDNWGCVLKSTSDKPVPGANKIDYYRKIDTVRNSNGVCSTQCPIGKVDIDGTCSCPRGQIVNSDGSCGGCAPGFVRDPTSTNLVCVGECPPNSRLIGRDLCECNEGYQKAPGRPGGRDPCYKKCTGSDIMSYDGNCYQCPDGLSPAYSPASGNMECIDTIGAYSYFGN